MAVFATEALGQYQYYQPAQRSQQASLYSQSPQAAADENAIMTTGGQLLKTLLSYGDYIIAGLPDPATAAQFAQGNTQLARDALPLLRDAMNKFDNMPNLLGNYGQ